jgi:hypothetical protein
MLVFAIMQFHRDMLDMEPILTNINQEIPLWTVYSMSALVGSAFGIGLKKFFFICIFLFCETRSKRQTP